MEQVYYEKKKVNTLIQAHVTTTSQEAKWLVLLNNYLDYHIKKNEMVRACSTYRRKERCIQGFRGETWGKETTWNSGVDGKTILKWIFKKWDEGAWIGLIWLRKGRGVGLL